MRKFYTLSGRKIITFSIMLFLSAMLSGCVNNGSFNFSSRAKIADYSSHSCDDIWTLKDDSAFDNALYWLRIMDCTKALSATGVQLQLNENTGVDWPVYFKRSILLAHISGTESEQRQMLEKLTQSKRKLSDPLQALVNLWVKNQQLQLALNIEKGKYQRLKESSETHVKELSDELRDVQIKLKSLTEIERQLPTRKSTKNGKAETAPVKDDTENGEVKNGSVTGATQPTETAPDSEPKEEQNTSRQL